MLDVFFKEVTGENQMRMLLKYVVVDTTCRWNQTVSSYSSSAVPQLGQFDRGSGGGAEFHSEAN